MRNTDLEISFRVDLADRSRRKQKLPRGERLGGDGVLLHDIVSRRIHDLFLILVELWFLWLLAVEHSPPLDVCEHAATNGV